MPRAKKSANPHNTRHENGVVAPGKRITKQKSTSHLNGTPEGKLGGNTPPIPQSPTHGLSYPQHLPTSNGNGTTLKGVHGTVAQHERAKNTFDPSSNDTEDYSSPNGKMAGELYHRKIDVNAVKIATHQDGGGMVHLALTVLRSCPRRDTLAILIFLLSIPPNILSLTNAAFAILTFVPPSGSFTSIPTLSDITSSSSPGAPSFTVMCLIDFIAFILWHFLHPILQSVILDCAQAMVATTLGGGYTHRPGVSDNTGLCLGVVAVTSVSRYKQIVLYRLHRSWIGRWIALFISLDSSYIPQTYSRNLNRTWWDTVTVLVALHIVCQGMTRNVRRHLYSSRNSSSVPTVRAVDPEAVVGAQAGFEGSEPIHNTPTSPTELKSRSSLQNIREIRDKVSSGKRRRKQGNYVRSQQPLWAAFAATKATIMREYEQSQATNDALVSNAKDAQNLGSAPFATEDNHIWITVVHSSSFCFETSPWAPNRLFTRGRDLSCINDSAGLKKLTPFYVRINGADWASVKIYAVPDTEDDRGRPYWTGEVYGLSPANTYQVTFTRCEDAAVVHSEIIATPASSISASEQAHSPSNSYVAPTLRPSSPASPIATLKKSIAAFEDNIIEVTNQQRRVRKDSKTNAATLRKEIDMLKERESKYANADDKLQSRHLQHTQHIRQADDSMTAITEELEFYETVPEDETRKWSEQRASWEAIRKEQTQAREDLYRTKEQNTRVHTSAQADYLSAGQKRERLQHRVTRLTNQHNNMLSSSPSAPLEQLRSNSDQSTKHNGRYQIEYNYQESINQLNRNYQDATYRLRSVTEHCNALKHAAEQASFQALVQNRQHISGSRPITPEGELPGTYPVPSSVGSTSLSRYAPYGSPEPHQMSIANGYGNGNATVHLRDSNNRARSASVLSGNSLYEDFDDEEFLPVIAGRFGGMVKEGSDGSGESGSGNASPHLKYRRTTSRT